MTDSDESPRAETEESSDTTSGNEDSDRSMYDSSDGLLENATAASRTGETAEETDIEGTSEPGEAGASGGSDVPADATPSGDSEDGDPDQVPGDTQSPGDPSKDSKATDSGDEPPDGTSEANGTETVGATAEESNTEASSNAVQSGRSDAANADSGGETERVNRMKDQGSNDQLVSAGSGEPERSTGTFYVKHVEDQSVTLHEIHTSQVYVAIENPDLERRQIIEATLVAQPPMNVSFLFSEIVSKRTIPVEVSDLEVTSNVREIGGEMGVGEAIAIEREGEGEIHILTVESGQAGERAEEISDDETTYKNAGRYEVDRVEIRTDEDDGIVSIRYLPD